MLDWRARSRSGLSVVLLCGTILAVSALNSASFDEVESARDPLVGGMAVRTRVTGTAQYVKHVAFPPTVYPPCGRCSVSLHLGR